MSIINDYKQLQMIGSLKHLDTICELSKENKELKERLNKLKEYVVRVPFPEYIKGTLLKMIGE